MSIKVKSSNAVKTLAEEKDLDQYHQTNLGRPDKVFNNIQYCAVGRIAFVFVRDVLNVDVKNGSRYWLFTLDGSNIPICGFDIPTTQGTITVIPTNTAGEYAVWWYPDKDYPAGTIIKLSANWINSNPYPKV